MKPRDAKIKVSLFRVSVTNASLVSGLYLLTAVVIELTRRIWNPRWVERALLSLEAFPARTLDFLGLFEPLRQAWAQGRLSAMDVRFIYGLTTVSVVFALSLMVGLVTALLARVLVRSGQSEDPPRES